MQISSRINDGVAVLSLSGRFDFNTHRTFRDGYESLINTPGVKSLDIDLAAVDYLDSSALGMLLLAKERTSTLNIRLRLTSCQGTVKQILDIANFGKIFTLA